MSELKLIFKPIDGNVPTQELADLLISKLNSFPELSEVNANTDVFSAIRSVMLKYQSSWGDSANRKAWSFMAHLCLASLESSFNWNEGRDMSANNRKPQTQESGVYQCSLNSIYTASLYSQDWKKLAALFTQHTGLPYSQSNAAGKSFITQMKIDHEFVVEFMLRLSRITTRTHGPLLRGEVNKFIKIEAVKEMEAFFKNGEVGQPEDPVVAGLPPKPTSYQELFRLYGNPQEKNWEKNNIEFCKVDSSLTAFPFITHQNSRGFYCNKRIIGQLQKVFAKIVARKLQKTIYTFDGCWVVRYVRGSTTKLSNHSWGLALDLDYEGNELGDTTPAIDMRLVACFEEEGFFCGGRYRGRKDWGHFDWSTGV